MLLQDCLEQQFLNCKTQAHLQEKDFMKLGLEICREKQEYGAEQHLLRAYIKNAQKETFPKDVASTDFGWLWHGKVKASTCEALQVCSRGSCSLLLLVLSSHYLQKENDFVTCFSSSSSCDWLCGHWSLCICVTICHRELSIGSCALQQGSGKFVHLGCACICMH